MWQKILVFLESAGWKLLWVAVALIVGLIIIKLVVKALTAVLKKTKIDGAVAHFITQIIKAVLWLVLIFTMLSILGVPITGMVAVVSAATVAIGVALQGSLGNLASGIIIAASKPFKEGHFIEVNGVSGTVKTINFFTTEIVTFDNKKIIIPNSLITSSTIINYNEQQQRMIPLVISVAYDSDMELVKKLLLDVAGAHPDVLDDPAPSARIAGFGDSAVDFNFRMWTATENYWSVLWDVNEAVFKTFKENGINIPFNQLDVFIKNRDALAKAEKEIDKK